LSGLKCLTFVVGDSRKFKRRDARVVAEETYFVGIDDNYNGFQRWMITGTSIRRSKLEHKHDWMAAMRYGTATPEFCYAVPFGECGPGYAKETVFTALMEP